MNKSMGKLPIVKIPDMLASVRLTPRPKIIRKSLSKLDFKKINSPRLKKDRKIPSKLDLAMSRFAEKKKKNNG